MRIMSSRALPVLVFSAVLAVVAGVAGGSPAGPTSLDSLEGISCSGVGGKPAHVHLVYGTGIEAPVSIECLTHLVANPGSVRFVARGGSIQLGLLPSVPLPSNWSRSADVDTQGRITGLRPVTFDNLPWSVTGLVSANGTMSLTLVMSGGTIVPAASSVVVDATASGVVTLHAVVPLVGTYDGTCAIGTPAAPLSVPFSSAPPGTPYDQARGTVTLAAPVTTPGLSNCSPPVPAGSLADAILRLFAGTGTVSIDGVLRPPLVSP